MERGEDRVIKQLAENSASIQRVSLSLIENVSGLTKRIDKLVSLFEEASKHVGEVELNDDRLKVLAGKLEVLLDQNRDLAKGLLLLEKYIRGRTADFSAADNFGTKGFSEFKTY